MRRNTLFNQITQLLNRYKFRNIVNRYQGDKYTKYMDCWQQLLILLYSQIKGLNSLRDIESSLRSHAEKWKHVGLKSVARSTLADANTLRPHEIFGELFYAFVEKCQRIAPRHAFRVNMPVFSLDSTLISLCLSSYPWAKYRRRKGAMKLHMLLDHEGCYPTFVDMTTGRCHDVRFAKDPEFGLPSLPPDSILTMDRAYVDFTWLYKLNSEGTTFIVRAKSNMKYRIIGQHKDPNEKRGVLSDDVIEMTNYYQKKGYPKKLRLVRYYDKERDKELSFITNNFTLAATTIARLYKGRWEIETFFKWIKQHLHIKTFLGTSPNAVMSQVWAALILYVLLSFIKFQTKYAHSLLDLLRIVRELIWESKSLIEVLRVNFDEWIKMYRTPIQLEFY